MVELFASSGDPNQMPLCGIWSGSALFRNLQSSVPGFVNPQCSRYEEYPDEYFFLFLKKKKKKKQQKKKLQVLIRSTSQQK